MKAIPTMVIALAFLPLISCNDDIEGIGPMVTQELPLALFETVDFQVSGNVTFEQGDEQRVMVTSHENIIARLKTLVSNNSWDVRFGSGNYEYDQLDIHIILPSLRRVSMSGSGSAFIGDFENRTDMEFLLRGSGQMEIGKVEGVRKVNVEISGSGDIEVLEESELLEELTISITGSGEYEGFRLSTAFASVDIAGSGNAEVTVNDRLEADITGSGAVFYRGEPVISAEISGSGRVIDAN